ncbi:MAG: orotidine-5'-phosphate decarboxylase [Elainellaceae cyanobacterium]
MTLAPRDRIIVPLDVPTQDDAIRLLDQLPDVLFWKVGLELFISTGPAILSELRSRQKKIFLDLKLHDIPNTMIGACRAAASYGVDLLTVHAAAGRHALLGLTETASQGATAAGHLPPKIIGVTLLTSLDSRALAFELRVPIELPEYVLQLALLARDSGLAGTVCSPQEADQLRRLCGEDFLLICPGIRPAWSDMGDQRRSLTPAEALKAGANYLVIGRPITAADSPIDAYRRVCDEITALK